MLWLFMYSYNMDQCYLNIHVLLLHRYIWIYDMTIHVSLLLVYHSGYLIILATDIRCVRQCRRLLPPVWIPWTHQRLSLTILENQIELSELTNSHSYLSITWVLVDWWDCRWRWWGEEKMKKKIELALIPIVVY